MNAKRILKNNHSINFLTLAFTKHFVMKKLSSTFIFSIICSYSLFSQDNVMWSTYYGTTGNGDGIGLTATDASGNVYLAGKTNSWTGIASGGFQNTGGGGFSDAFLVKFDATGNRLWATYYGGGSSDYGMALAVDSLGNIYLAGYTSSTTGIASGGFQNTYGGGSDDAFLVKFDSNGNRIWGTYYGGSAYDYGLGVAIDSSGNVYLSGTTASTSGIASGGFQNTFGGGLVDSYVVKFNSNGARLWATYCGGTSDDRNHGAATDFNGNVYIAGETGSSSGIASGGFQNTYAGGSYDAYLVKYNSSGNRLWGTYYGGIGSWIEYGNDVATDLSGNVYLIGYTGCHNGISFNGFQNTCGGGVSEAFFVKFDSVGTRIWASWYGGTANEEGYGVATDPSGNVYITGITGSATNISSGGFQNTPAGGYDGFLAKFDSSGNRLCATYFGGTASDYFYTNPSYRSGYVYAGGETSSSSGIALSGFQNTLSTATDAFLTKFTTTCLTTSLSESENISSINIYPNPSNGKFYLQGITTGEIEIYNTLGEKIFSQKIVSDETQIYLNNQPKGIYFLLLTQDNKNFATDKLIITDN